MVDAAGHETYQFRTLVTLMRDTLEVRCLVLSAPRPLVYAAGRVIGLFVGDVVLTRDEIAGLSGGLCVSDSPHPPTTAPNSPRGSPSTRTLLDGSTPPNCSATTAQPPAKSSHQGPSGPTTGAASRPARTATTVRHTLAVRGGDSQKEQIVGRCGRHRCDNRSSPARSVPSGGR